MSETNAKQQIVDKIKDSTNILVTVSKDPSVDELSAALGLSLLLNKMKKHATAVFSGEIPPAINFLDPEKTFENSVDSLRDFIIALNKDKADHLRYKVEGDVVKIFITPYKTTITSDDLDFSQGDYNVELVLALGVKQQGSLDKALEAHGQIFDDATVATIMAGSDKSELSAISWRDSSASSLSEMVFSLGDALKIDKGFIDEPIATAFLAGIVSATERFSNNKTSARVMKISSELMAAGANQQLIASKFEEAVEEEVKAEEPLVEEIQTEDKLPEPAENPEESPEVPEIQASEPENVDGTASLSEGESTKIDRDDEPTEPATEEGIDLQEDEVSEGDAGKLSISHEMEGTLDEVAKQKAIDDQAEAAKIAEAAASAAQPVEDGQFQPSEELPPVSAPVEPDISPDDLRQDVAAVSAEVEQAAEAPQLQGAVSSEVWRGDNDTPSYGGTLNATAEAAADEARRLADNDRNKTILSHSRGYIADQIPTFESPINAASQAPEEEAMVNPLGGPGGPTLAAAPIEPISPEMQNFGESSGIPELPPLPDFSTLPPPPPPPAFPGQVGEPMNSQTGEILGDILPPANQPAPAEPVASDPGQFRIPGQG